MTNGTFAESNPYVLLMLLQNLLVVAALKYDGTSIGKIYELGGPEVFTAQELVICHYLFIFFFLSFLFNSMNNKKLVGENKEEKTVE